MSLVEDLQDKAEDASKLLTDFLEKAQRELEASFEELITEAEREDKQQAEELDSWEEQLDAKAKELEALRDSPWLREIIEAALAHDRIATEYNLRRLGFVLSTLSHEAA